jgi:hypothetical protein
MHLIKGIVNTAVSRVGMLRPVSKLPETWLAHAAALVHSGWADSATGSISAAICTGVEGCPRHR